MIMVRRVRDGDAFESDVTLTEKRVEEFICQAGGVLRVRILS